VQEQDGKSFVVPFPSLEELERMIAIRTITTKNREGTIIFEEFVDDVQPIKVLEQVWVTVTKVPRVLRSFLALWAVGSIMGATQKVDMVHLRATGQVHILVAVLDVKKIPKQADVCVGNSVYRLLFKTHEAIHNNDSDPDDDDLLGDDDNLSGGDRVMKDAEDEYPKPQDPNPKTLSDKSQAPPQNMPHQQQSSLVGVALDQGCEQLLNEISLKVMLEADDGATLKTYSPLMEEELAAYNALAEYPNHIHPSSISVLPSSLVSVGDVAADLQGCAVADTALV
jgi:hypothetical protein